ncbi:olfactory receptor 8G1-like [Erethizon dorsatum]
MTEGNHSTVTEFILAGITEKSELQIPLILLFLAIYMFTVVGNLGMITLIGLSSHLHTPMYYLLSSLSFIDLCHSTVITPRMLVNFVTEKNVISFPECLAQFYLFSAFAIAECHMLAAMAYDRYVAICNPLLYNVTMSSQVCCWLVAGVYSMGLAGATAHTVCMLRVLFCKADVINHFFCDLFPLLELSCSSTFINEVVVLCLSVFNILLPAFTILSSYIFIIASILHIRSTAGRSKAFSTCSSHLSAVAVFFGSLSFTYLQPSSVSSMDRGKVSSVFYTIIVPMLNPLIYSLKNKDVNIALKFFKPQKEMEEKNHTIVTEFILAGLTERPELQLPLFLLFLGIYVLTVVGNLGMIALIGLSSHLHTPMYYLLSSLSFIDLCHSTVITPKMLVNSVTEKNVISYSECMTQLYFFSAFAISECHMLAAMAYDRYVAICNPLLYTVTMSSQVCCWLVAGVYSMGLAGATAHTVCMLRVDFCKVDVINHYFCDLFPLLELSCSSTFINEVVVLCLSALNILLPAFTILSSYIFIIASILRIRSTAGRSKAFRTCSSHILAVAVFFGSAAFMYLQPSSVSSMDRGKLSSVFYTTLVPMLNPLIYSLKNKDVKVALKNFFKKRKFL